MSAQHTPGPWFSAHSGVWVARDWGNQLIAQCGMKGMEAEMPGNARLIAAAPELLAALEVIADVLEKEKLLFVHIVMARAVIRTAKGE